MIVKSPNFIFSCRNSRGSVAKPSNHRSWLTRLVKILLSTNETVLTTATNVFTTGGASEIELYSPCVFLGLAFKQKKKKDFWFYHPTILRSYQVVNIHNFIEKLARLAQIKGTRDRDRQRQRYGQLVTGNLKQR